MFRSKISPWELVMIATRHEALLVFHVAMAYFVIPLTVVTLGVTVVQAVRRKPAISESQPSDKDAVSRSSNVERM